MIDCLCRRSHQTVALRLIICACLFALVGCASSTHPTAGILPTATSAAILLTTDFTIYNSGQAIGVTVRNSSTTPYFANDTHTACTIITLQRSINGTWVPVMPCQTGAATHILLIAAHSSVPYTLAPGNAAGDPNAWAPGTYRVMLSYGARADGTDATAFVAYSAGITVAA